MALLNLVLQQYMIEDDTSDVKSSSDTCGLTPEKKRLKLLNW
jgi:hypothetical protein